jgi:hypothetical protein
MCTCQFLIKAFGSCFYFHEAQKKSEVIDSKFNAILLQLYDYDNIKQSKLASIQVTGANEHDGPVINIFYKQKLNRCSD